MASNNNEGAAPAVEGSVVERDQELDDLLDSALGDFDAGPPKVADPSEPSPKDGPPPGSETLANATEMDKLFEGIWSEDVMKDAMSQFEKSMKTLFTADGKEPDEGMAEQLSKEFCKMAEESVKTVLDGSEERGGDFNAAIKQTLKNLADNSKNIQGGVENPEELMAMLSNLDLGQEAGGGGEGDVPPDIFSCCNKLMQMFLSKETLYEPFKEICDKYPAWLEQNKPPKLTQDEYDKYEGQFGMMKKVCEEFEKMDDSDSDDTKSDKFKSVLKLMEQMQNFGYPPEQLIGDSRMNISDDMISGLLPGGVPPSECSLM